MRRYLTNVALFAAGAALTAGVATGIAQAPATVLDGVYTAAQATRGDAAYAASCVGCHEGTDADGPLLTGRAFLDRWREDSLEPLFSFIKTRMPGNRPGGLDDGTYVDVLAYILQTNGYPAGNADLSAAAIERTQLIGVDGPRPLANLTIVRVVGCLSPEANNTWVLDRAGKLTPVRSRVVDGTTPEELQLSAAQPLGAQRMPLTSVPLQGPSYAGHKVQVKGVLTRQGTTDRVNVMSINSVAATCGA